MKKIISALVLLIAPLLALQSAQAFPDRPVKLVVPTPAGGPPDIMARLLSDKIGAALGQPVIVENRPGGAGGTIGGKSVLTAEPDGYTLLIGSTSAVIIAPLVHKSAGYTSETFAACCGALGDDRSAGLASVGAGQVRRRICQPGEVAAEYAPVRLGRNRRVATS